jgi:hypothetical protein
VWRDAATRGAEANLPEFSPMASAGLVLEQVTDGLSKARSQVTQNDATAGPDPYEAPT